MEPEETEQLTKQAIDLALTGSWSEAVALNEQILKLSPQDIETLNRLGRAYLESGMIGKAKTIYRQVLELDPYNTIAAKNIERLSALTKKDLERAQRENGRNGQLSADLFLEEPGRTRVIEMIDLASPKILAILHTGDPVDLEVKGEDVICLLNKKRLGKLSVEFAPRVAQAIKKGSRFSSVIKAVTVRRGSKDTTVTVFLREVVHSNKLGGGPVFPVTGNHTTSFVREDSLPLMDNREGMIMENDEEMTEESTRVHIPENDPDQAENPPAAEDDDDFASS